MSKSILEKLTEYFENTPKEKILEDWKAVEKYSKIGPSVDEFISQTKNTSKITTPLNLHLAKKVK